METDTKNILAVIVIGISLLVYSIYTKQYALIAISVEFIILSVIEFSMRELNYIVLGDKVYFEWIISTILFILIFCIFYKSIYKDLNNNPSSSMSVIALCYFNWFYLTNLLTNYINSRINNYIQYE